MADRLLRHAGAIKGSSVLSAEGAPVGTGQVADTFRYALTYDTLEQSAPKSVVAKLSAADESSRGAAVAYRLYEREVRFYAELLGRVNVRAPRCYYGDVEPDTGRFVLILEDLSPASPINQLAGFNVDHAGHAMDQAAALHAPLWGDASLTELDWLIRSSAQAEMMSEVLPKLIDAFLARYQDDLEPECLALIDSLKGHMAAFWDGQRGPLTVTHGDFRADNMLFGAQDGAVPLAVVDWQTVGQGPGLLDVAYVLGTSLDTEVRRANEEELVGRYHAALQAGGVRDYSWDQCWHDYRRDAIYAIYFLAPAAVMVERTARGDAMFLSMIRRASAARHRSRLGDVAQPVTGGVSADPLRRLPDPPGRRADRPGRRRAPRLLRPLLVQRLHRRHLLRHRVRLVPEPGRDRRRLQRRPRRRPALGLRVGPSARSTAPTRRIGPIKVEIVEPMRTTRVTVDAPEHGLDAELVFEARTAAFEEPRQTRYQDARVTMDVTRATQFGNWSGTVSTGGTALDLAGRTFRRLQGPLVGRAAGRRAGADGAASAAPQLCFLWAPLNFDDAVVHYIVFEDADGDAVVGGRRRAADHRARRPDGRARTSRSTTCTTSSSTSTGSPGCAGRGGPSCRSSARPDGRRA